MRNRSLLFVLSVMALVAVGCTEEHSSFYISGNLFPKLEEGGCTYDVSNANRLGGTYDVGFNRSYFVYPRYQNTARSRAKGIVSDTLGIRVQGVEVTLVDAEGNVIIEYTVPTSTFVPSSSDGIAPGQAAGAVPLIPPGVLDVPAGVVDLVVAEVKAFGETLGGTDVESSVWSWVIDVCNGCLARCGLPGETFEGVCNLGTDDVVLIPATDPLCAGTP